MLRSQIEWATALKRHKAVVKVSDLTGAIQITRGRYFWPLEPHHPGNDIDIEQIAHVLAGTRRWGCNTIDENGDPSDYSVAQHSVHVSEIVEKSHRQIVPKWDWDNSPDPALHGLMHDSPEAYIQDIVRPVKYRIGDVYHNAEDGLLALIYQNLGIEVDQAVAECVRRVDSMMIFLERDALMGKPCVPYTHEMDHPRVTMQQVVPEFRVWSAWEAKENFLARFEELMARRERIIVS